MRKYFVIAIITFLIVIFGGNVDAATFKITASKTQVSPNETFSISVGGDCIGRVNLSVSNGTLSDSSVWVEQNSQKVNVKAGSSGTVTITATPAAGFSDADANEYKPGAKSVKVTIALPNSTQSVPNKNDTNKPTVSKPMTNGSQTTTKPSTNTNNSNKQDKVTNTSSKPTEDNHTVEEKSANNLLSSLNTNIGNLSPDFNANINEYSISLSKDVETITINAESQDSKAVINGIGDIKLIPGDNVITIVVTSENGEERIYTIKAYVDETPLVYVKYKEKELGVARNLKDITIPDGFSEKQHNVNGYTIKTFSNEKFSIICGIDSENNKELYVFDTEKNECVSKIIPMTINKNFFYLEDLETYLCEAEEKILKLYEKEIPINYEQYEELVNKENTKQIIIYVLSGVLGLSVICWVYLFLKLRKEKLDEEVH